MNKNKIASLSMKTKRNMIINWIKQTDRYDLETIIWEYDIEE